MNLHIVPTDHPDAAPVLHTGAAVWTYIDGTRVLRIAGAPFAAMPDQVEKNLWHIFFIEGRRTVGFTKGDRHDARSRLISTERDYLAQLAKQG
jgi:hypothetical protein